MEAPTNTRAPPADGEGLNPFGFFRTGMKLAGFDRAAEKQTEREVTKTDMRRFRAQYGLDPAGMSSLYSALKTQAANEGFKCPPARDVFIGLFFAKQYVTEHSMASRFGLSELTLRKKVKNFYEKAYMLHSQKVCNEIRNMVRILEYVLTSCLID